MSNVAALKENLKALPFNQAMLSGRLSTRRKFKGSEGQRWYQLLRIPAADAYSMPSVVEIKSVQPLGEDGQDWSGPVFIKGIPRQFSTNPDNDGVITEVKTAIVILEAVES